MTPPELEIPPRRRKPVATEKPEPAPRRGWPGHLGEALLCVLSWTRSHASSFAWLYTRVPFTWRLALRRRIHAATGTPMPPLLPATKRYAKQINHSLAPPITSGVNLLGYARGEFGVAESMRAYARSLEQSGYPFLIFNFDVGRASRQQDHSMDRHLSETLRYAINAFFINADQMPIARSLLGRQVFRGHHNIGFWLWELERFPRDWNCALDLVDEVWAPTAFVRDAIGAATNKPVLRMPMAVEPKAPVSMDRAYFGLPRDGFVFLFSYDFNGFASRKNPEATIAAFRQAFDDGTRDVRLLLKSSNGARFPDQLASLERLVAADPRIELRDGFLSREEMFGLQNATDCFVSLHRSEGFGMGLAECMYFGKPVIATGYSGNLDFMDHDNSLLVDYRMIPLSNGDYPYWRGQQWADPDIAHAARWMRRLFDDRDLAHRIGANAAASIRHSHSREVCATALATRLQQIDRQRSST
jgi:glycosyltransferase involved in cell wall biosynthesis